MLFVRLAHGFMEGFFFTFLNPTKRIGGSARSPGN
jgi:hypothetical protein